MFEYAIRLMRSEIFRLIAEKEPMLWTDTDVKTNMGIAKELEKVIQILKEKDK